MRWLVATMCVVLACAAKPAKAEAIGMCEPVLTETWLIGASASRRQVAIGHSAPTCVEVQGSDGTLDERWQSHVAIHIYDHRGRRVKVIKLKGDADAAKHPYIVRNKFVKLTGKRNSPNGRCAIVGAASKKMSIRRGRRTLFTQRLDDGGLHRSKATSYWFAAGRLLVLELDTTINPGHPYAEFKTGSAAVISARKHGLRSCF